MPGSGRSTLYRYLQEPELVPQTFWTYNQAGHNQDAKKELVRIIDFEDSSDVLITPKPVKLLQRILRVATDRDSIVLDSFAGSGTTAHAVLKQNAEDWGERKFVLVEMEDYAHSLTAERVRRVIRGEGGHLFLGNEIGFDFYELAGELFAALGERINPEVDKEALGRFAFFLETGLALDHGAAGAFGSPFQYDRPITLASVTYPSHERTDTPGSRHPTIVETALPPRQPAGRAHRSELRSAGRARPGRVLRRQGSPSRRGEHRLALSPLR